MRITPPAPAIRRAASRAHRSTPSRFTARTRRQSSGVLSRKPRRTLIPALATSTSTPPRSESTSAKTSETSASSDTSASSAATSPSTDSSGPSATDTTRAPSAANFRDVAAPIPLVPPVTTTRLPSRRRIARSYDAAPREPVSLLVLQRVEHVEPRRPPRRHDRRHHPGDDRDDREDHERQHRHVEADALVREPLRHERRQEEPERQPEPSPDQRRDHALVPDHPPDLAARHPDRPQHPELARPLEDREHERVHHPEQAHDHGQGQQHVEELEQLVDAVRAIRHPVVTRPELDVRETRQRLPQPRPRRVAGTAPHVHEREQVLRPREARVEGV